MSLNVSQYRKRLLTTVIVSWLIVFFINEDHWQLLIDYGYFFLVGLFGAIVANSTGAGGGIIFIPFFTSLGIEGTQALGTSILIQCFGMTAGAISWLTTSHIAKTNSHHISRLIFRIIVFCGMASIAGILCGQYLVVPDDPAFMAYVFKIFSIVFGLIILVIIYYSKRQIHTQFDLHRYDLVLFMSVSFIGGLITAWISVGVGEIIAIALMLRRFPTMVAISMGVVLSSISVITAAFYHIIVLSTPDWSVVTFAVPGAILGGTFAYLLSEKLGPINLKIFFSIWIILTGLTM